MSSKKNKNKNHTYFFSRLDDEVGPFSSVPAPSNPRRFKIEVTLENSSSTPHLTSKEIADPERERESQVMQAVVNTGWGEIK